MGIKTVDVLIFTSSASEFSRHSIAYAHCYAVSAIMRNYYEIFHFTFLISPGKSCFETIDSLSQRSPLQFRILPGKYKKEHRYFCTLDPFNYFQRTSG